MIGLGTIVNAGAIILGAICGLLLKKGLSDKIKNIIMSAVALSVMFIGISGVLSGMLIIDNNKITVSYTMLIILSLVIGGIVGEFINIESLIEKFGVWCKQKAKIKGEDNKFVEGFVSATLIYCVGAMAIVGSLEDGISANHTVLFAKSVLDGVTAIIFASASGIGVMFSCLPVLLYQGIITLSADFLSPYMSDVLITQMSVVGNVLVFAIGVNMLFGNKIKVGNLLPAIFVPVIYNIFLILIGRV